MRPLTSAEKTPIVVLEDAEVVASGDVEDPVHVGRHAVPVDDDDRPGAGSDAPLHVGRVEGGQLAVETGEHRDGAAADDRQAGERVHGRLDDHLVARHTPKPNRAERRAAVPLGWARAKRTPRRRAMSPSSSAMGPPG